MREQLAAALMAATMVCACGGAAEQTRAVEAPAATARWAELTPSERAAFVAGVQAEITGPPKPWAEMSKPARGAYMMEAVAPAMGKLFRAFEPNLYADFGCTTCHGDDAKARGMAMPSAALYRLYPTGTPQQEKMVAERRPTLVFMFNAVVPTMHKLLGAAPYDDETKTGFTCFACHPKGE